MGVLILLDIALGGGVCHACLDSVGGGEVMNYLVDFDLCCGGLDRADVFFCGDSLVDWYMIEWTNEWINE